MNVALKKHDIDIVTLQEVWHPKDEMIFKEYQKPHLKLREGKEGGGVGIAVSSKVKMVKRPEYEVKGLEAVWAEVRKGNVQTLIGSVYINVGKLDQMSLLDKVLDKIVNENKRIIISMDANARNSMWDNECSNLDNNRISKKMGVKLQEIIDNHNLFVHNSGAPTYESGEHVSAIDVTLSLGICDEHRTKWTLIEEDLGSPHSGIILEVGNRVEEKISVINWKDFDWEEYENKSREKLQELLDKWRIGKSSCQEKNLMLQESIEDLIDQIAVRKTICKHSRPWINPEISDLLMKLKNQKKRFMKHRSPSNKLLYEKKREKVLQEIESAHERWKIDEFEKIAKESSDKEKWKGINRMTNSDFRFDIQPIRKTDPVTKKQSYLFKDDEILLEMENYHISKEKSIDTKRLNTKIKELKDENAKEMSEDWMNCEINGSEIDSTFGICTGPAGPDNVHGNLLDKADRGKMHQCLSVIWNQAWKEGIYIEGWKEEHRAVLPKPNKDDFHLSDSYRTVSLTSVIGKRFEKITGRRLLVFLEGEGFDVDQYAYLEGRSSTQAALLLTEQVKRARQEKKKVGAVFFDFSDAFGNVDRIQLLDKIKSLGVRGRIFDHIADFLCNRKARIKVSSETTGDWKDSTMGTSAGTVLGPILFIIFAKDIPKEIAPKFADDTVAIAIGEDSQEVQEKLQYAVNKLFDWSKKWGMILNIAKTKVINFSVGKKDNLVVKLEGEEIKNCNSIKYLGLVLDHNLDFNSHVDSVIGKANSALNKVCVMIKGRRGLPLDIAIDLYRSLVRPHLEYAIPVWAMLNGKQLLSLERVQSKCLKKILGVFASTSSNAIEVVANIIPFRLRVIELCNKEWVRTMSLSDNHNLKKMIMHGSSYNGKEGTPLGYLNFVSKDISSRLESENLSIIPKVVLDTSIISNQLRIQEEEILQGKLGNSKNRTQDQERQARVQFEAFYEKVSEKTILAFSDGSVAGENCFGEGGCGVVLHRKSKGELAKSSIKVGKMVDNVACEVEGVLRALEMIIEECKKDKTVEKGYVLTDCKSAIDILGNQNNIRKNLNELKRLWSCLEILKEVKVDVKVGWVPGHADIELNDEADRLAKIGSTMGSELLQTTVSEGVLNRWIKEKAMKSWKRMWDISESGTWTRELIGKVGRKIRFPKDRSTGISYVRLLVNNTAVKENMFRFKLADDRECECGEGIQTVHHVIMECKLEEEFRKNLEDEIGNLWMNEIRKAGHLSFNIQTILAPFSVDKLKDSEADKILDFSFSFLRKISQCF